MKMSENIGKILWGLLFLVGAVYLIASRVWNLPTVSVFSVILTVFLAWLLIEGLRHLNFWEILFPIAFFCIIYAKPLGITAFTPWPVLGAALLGSIGLSMIFKPKKHRTWSEGHMYGNMAIFASTTVLESRLSISTPTIFAAYRSITVSDRPAYTLIMRSSRERAHRFMSITVSVRSVSMFRVHGMWMSMWIKHSAASICVDEWKARAHIA
mgnify:CR=1 FL=1